ncbi:MAG: hypothetical protein GX444_18905 [Myxococcales bacterium]|nr:hypothetical protein [Myxococcales bacterium]
MRCLLPVLALLILLGAAVPAHAAGEPSGPWHAEITDRPRLLGDASLRDTILDRLSREPYLALMARVRGRANNGFSPTPPDPYDPGREYGLSNIAKAAAFVAWIDDDAALADRAAQALEAMAPDFGASPYQMFIDSDIHIAEAVVGYCYAYDILAGTGLIAADRLAAIADRLGGMIALWYSGFIDQLAVVTLFLDNNHGTKTGAAFAVAGMTLNQRDDANKWFNFGMTYAYDIWFDSQVVPGGVVAEGTYYAEYSAVNHLPVFYSYNELIGEDATLQKRDACLLGPNCNWSAYDIVNPLDHPKNYESHLWFVKARRPDGSAPALDDANPTGYFNGLVSAYYDDGRLAWEWLNNSFDPLFTTHCSELNVEAIAWYDDAVAATPPGDDFGPNFLLPTEGQAIFRSGWGAADSWVMMLAENGQARKKGSGHEHSDNLSLAFFARGEDLLLDPGYIAWEEHNKVRLGIHHNVPTVDGQGPPSLPDYLMMFGGTDAFFVDGLTDVAAPFATAASSWSDADFRRTLLFPDDDYLVVFDRMSSAEPREYGVLWHGQAGGNSGYPFTPNDDGGTWAPGDAAVDVHVGTSAGATAATTSINIHSYGWMNEIEHVSLDTRATAATAQARFLSVAVPYSTAKEEPRAVEWLSRDDLIAARIAGDATDFAAAQPARAPQSFSAVETGSLALKTDAETLLLRTADGADGYAYLDGGGYLMLHGLRPWNFGPTERVWLEWEGDQWWFELPESGGMIVTYAAYLPDIEAAGDVGYSLRGGILRVWSHGAASVMIDFAYFRNRR